MRGATPYLDDEPDECRQPASAAARSVLTTGRRSASAIQASAGASTLISIIEAVASSIDGRDTMSRSARTSWSASRTDTTASNRLGARRLGTRTPSGLVSEGGKRLLVAGTRLQNVAMERGPGELELMEGREHRRISGCVSVDAAQQPSEEPKRQQHPDPVPARTLIGPPRLRAGGPRRV